MDASVKVLLEVVDKASPELQRFQQNLANTEKALVSFAGKVGTLAGAGLATVVTGLSALAKQAINTADDMGKAAQSAGISVEAFSGLAYAAKLGGTSTEQLSTAFNMLNKSMVEAGNKSSGAAAAFKYLGVEVKNSDGTFRKADEVFKDISEKFSKLPDGVSKSAVAMELFGKSGAALIPTLNGGKASLEELRIEAERLGLIITKDTAKASEQFNDSLTRMGNAAQGTGMMIAKEVLPTLNALSAGIIDVIKNSDDFKSFAEGVGQVFKFVVKVVATAISTINAFGKGIGAVMAAVASAASRDFKSAGEILKMWKGDVDDINAANEKFIAGIEKGIPAINANTTAVTSTTGATNKYTGASKKAKEATDAQAKAFNQLMESLLKETEGYKNLTNVQKVQILLATDKYKKLTALQKAQAVAAAEEADAVARLNSYYTSYSDKMTGYAQTVRGAASAFDILKKTGELLIEDGPGVANTFRVQKEAAEAYKLELAALQDKLELLKAAPEKLRNEKAIEQTAAAIEGMTQATAKGQADAIYKMAEYAAATYKVKENLSRFAKYIGDARDRTKELATTEQYLNAFYADRALTVKEARQKELAYGKLREEQFADMRANVTTFEKKVADVAATLQSTFGDMFYSVMQGTFSDIGKLFKNLIDRMVADALAAKLASLLFGDFTNTGRVGGTGGGLLTAVMGGGGWQGIFRENGGPVTAGQPYIVGERRPELFIPQTNGTIMPDTSALAGGGGNQINFSITAMDSQDVIRAMDKIKRPLTEMINGTNKSYNMR